MAHMRLGNDGCGTNRMSDSMLNPEEMSADQYRAHKSMLRDVQFAIIEFEDIERYPPFSLSSKSSMRSDFNTLYWKLWKEGNDRLMREIPVTFRPYKELYAQFGDAIKQAKEYRDKSNGHPPTAAKLYAKDHNIKLSDEDYFIS